MKVANKLMLIGGICIFLVIFSLVILFRVMIFSQGNDEVRIRANVDNSFVTKDFNLTGFEGIKVFGGWQINIKRGDKYSVKIQIPKQSLDTVIAKKEGKNLILSVKRHQDRDGGFLSAVIVTPKLESIKASGAADINFSNFEISSLSIKTAGANNITGKNNFIKHLKVKGSGVTNLTLDKSKLMKVELQLSGASHARLNFVENGALFGNISGVSSVVYKGKLKNEKIKTTGLARVSAE